MQLRGGMMFSVDDRGWGGDTEVVERLAPDILLKVLADMQNTTVYKIMADKSIDIPNIEQAVVCIMYVCMGGWWFNSIWQLYLDQYTGNMNNF